jgi:hypothetical protein
MLDDILTILYHS